MNDSLTNELTRQLHAQADAQFDHGYGAPLSLDDVQGKARSIRRRRGAVAAGVAAAVLAVAVPVGLQLGDPSAQRPDPAETPTEVVEDPTYDGPVLGVPYLDRRLLVMPDGSTHQLPVAYQGGAVLGDTVLGLRNNDSGFLVLDVLDAQGAVVDSVPTESGITFNADESAIAYVTDGELVIRWEDGETVIGDFGAVTPVRLLGGPDCTEGVNDCIVYLNGEDGTPLVVTNFGSSNGVNGDPLAVADVTDDGRISMITGLNDEPEQGACSAVYDQTAGERVHESCQYTYGTFSPDGALLSATHAYQDGFGDGWRAILDAETGTELARFESPGGIVSSVWEDNSHLLVTSYEEGRWQVTRLAADGSTEVVLGPTKGSDFEPRYSVLGESF